MSDWRKKKFYTENMKSVQKYAIDHNIKSFLKAYEIYNSKNTTNKKTTNKRKRTQKGGGCTFHKNKYDCEIYSNECEGHEKILEESRQMRGGGGGGVKQNIRKKSQKGCSKIKTQKGCSNKIKKKKSYYENE